MTVEKKSVFGRPMSEKKKVETVQDDRSLRDALDTIRRHEKRLKLLEIQLESVNQKLAFLEKEVVRKSR